MPTEAPDDTLERSPLHLAHTLRPTINRLARRLRQQDNTLLRPTATAALGQHAQHAGLTHGELAGYEQLAPPTITSIVGKMEGMGLIRRETDAADRRVTRIRITEQGLDQLESIRTRRTSWLAARLLELDDADREALAAAAGI